MDSLGNYKWLADCAHRYKGFLNFLKYTDSTPIASEWEVWTKVKKQNARADRTGNKLESGFFSSYWELSFSRKIY